jgi:hypothetical protein
MTIKPTMVDLFDGKFQKRNPETEEPSKLLLAAERLLKKLIASHEDMISEIDYHIYFNDVDAISDCIDSYHENMVTIVNEVTYLRENPSDILFDFKRKFRTKTRFRRYANNKRTSERLG